MVGFVGLTTVVYPVHIDKLWNQCVRARPCQTTELPCWLNEVCKAHSDHIVTLLNEKELHNTYWSNWETTRLNICLKIVWKTFAKKRSPEVSLGGIKTLPWSLVWLVQVCKAHGPTTSRILGWNKLEDGPGLHYHELPQASTSTMRFHCHWFMFEVLQATTIQSCLQWGTTMLTPLRQKHLPG